LVPTFDLQVFDRQRPVFSDSLSEPIEFGRQEKEQDPLFVKLPCTSSAAGCRVFIARLQETNVSRGQLRIEPLAGDRIRVTNLSSKNPIMVRDSFPIAPQSSCELAAPVLLSFADKSIRVELHGSEAAEFQSLLQRTMVGAQSHEISKSRTRFGTLPLLPEPEAESLVTWLQTVTNVLRSAGNSNDFFQRAAKGMVDLVGLDAGRVVLWDEHRWSVVASFTAHGIASRPVDRPPSSRVLDVLQREKRTIWQVPSLASQSIMASLVDVQAVVAAPILNRHDEVIGALYGDRLLGTQSNSEPHISRLEAMLVETLACGVEVGLARVEQEKVAVAARVQFEQFFTPELSRQLAAEPDMLKGRDADVTLLFCDIRGFSRISERLGPARTVEWLGGVMTVLSECVIAHHGVLVDYIGDELVAMWGAPTEQADHAELACRAAMDILRAVPELNERWDAYVGEPLRFGIGLNTGPARVGNTGTPRKFKYGPLGNTVNLASRVQGVTKYLKSPILVTEATRNRLGPEFAARKICQVRVVNISEAVALYELGTGNDPHWSAICKLYEQALHCFEQRSFREAAKILGNLLAEYPDDGPALVLLSRAVNALVKPDTAFDPVWELSEK
jgi:adenylate cyclase